MADVGIEPINITIHGRDLIFPRLQLSDLGSLREFCRQQAVTWFKSNMTDLNEFASHPAIDGWFIKLTEELDRIKAMDLIQIVRIARSPEGSAWLFKDLIRKANPGVDEDFLTKALTMDVSPKITEAIAFSLMGHVTAAELDELTKKAMGTPVNPLNSQEPTGS